MTQPPHEQHNLLSTIVKNPAAWAAASELAISLQFPIPGEDVTKMNPHLLGTASVVALKPTEREISGAEPFVRYGISSKFLLNATIENGGDSRDTPRLVIREIASTGPAGFGHNLVSKTPHKHELPLVPEDPLTKDFSSHDRAVETAKLAILSAQWSNASNL